MQFGISPKLAVHLPAGGGVHADSVKCKNNNI